VPGGTRVSVRTPELRFRENDAQIPRVECLQAEFFDWVI
jgi:hypothetical protein